MDAKVYVAALFDIVAGQQEAVQQAFRKVAEETRREPGCISYMLTQNRDQPLSYVILECWASEEDLAAHMQRPHLKEFQKAVEGLRENRVIHKLTKII